MLSESSSEVGLLKKDLLDQKYDIIFVILTTIIILLVIVFQPFADIYKRITDRGGSPVEEFFHEANPWEHTIFFLGLVGVLGAIFFLVYRIRKL